jgi:hypothetical protein
MKPIKPPVHPTSKHGDPKKAIPYCTSKTASWRMLAGHGKQARHLTSHSSFPYFRFTIYALRITLFFTLDKSELLFYVCCMDRSVLLAYPGCLWGVPPGARSPLSRDIVPVGEAPCGQIRTCPRLHPAGAYGEDLGRAGGEVGGGIFVFFSIQGTNTSRGGVLPPSAG